MKLPVYLQYEPVGECNLRCQMFVIQYRSSGHSCQKHAFSEWDGFTGIVDDFPDLEHLHLQGMGEPMLHPLFFDMVRYAAAETYERIHVSARYDRVLSNLKLLLDVRSRYGSAKPYLHMVMVVMRQNLEEISDLVRLASKWHADELFVQHLSHDLGEKALPARYLPMRAFIEDQTLEGEVSQLVTRYFDEAWQPVSCMTVRNCWRLGVSNSGGVFPDTIWAKRF